MLTRLHLLVTGMILTYCNSHISEFCKLFTVKHPVKWLMKIDYVEMLDKNPNAGPPEQAEIRERANRAGALALLGLSAVGLLTSAFVPLFYSHFSTKTKGLFRDDLKSVHWYHRVKFPGITLRLIWIWAQLFYALCSFAIVLIPVPLGKVIIVSFMGVCWGVITWAPMAMVNIEILRIGESHTRLDADGKPDEETSVGTMLGINNIYIAAPQILGLLASSVIFLFVRKAGATNAIMGTSWVLAMGGVASLGAALMLYYIKDR